MIDNKIKEDLMQPKINNNNMYTTVDILNEIELKRIEIDKNLFLRVIQIGDNKFIDISKFYSGRPTKKGIRFNMNLYNNFKEKINNL